MYQLKEVKTLIEAKRVAEFLTSADAFDQTWAPAEKSIVHQAPVDSLKNKHHKYWYIEKGDQVIAAAGVRENKYGSGGYEMDSDYIAVHRNFRQAGLGCQLLTQIKNYVKNQKGRYIHVVSCDIDSYKPARLFYKKLGYKQVSHIPDYYVKGEGRIDLFKALS